jgi:hypothetical protein
MIPPPLAFFEDPSMSRNMKTLQVGGILILAVKPYMLTIVPEVAGVKPFRSAGGILGHRA